MAMSERDKAGVALAVLILACLGSSLAFPAETTPVASPATMATLTPRPTGSPVAEDDLRFNCLTMGNRLCGPSWIPVPRDLYGPLNETVADRDWRDCLIHYGDTTVVACADGGVYTS